MLMHESLVEIETNVSGNGSLKLNGQDLSMVVSGVDIRIRPGEVTDVLMHIMPDRCIGSMLVKDCRLNIDDVIKAVSKAVEEGAQPREDNESTS